MGDDDRALAHRRATPASGTAPLVVAGGHVEPDGEFDVITGIYPTDQAAEEALARVKRLERAHSQTLSAVQQQGETQKKQGETLNAVKAQGDKLAAAVELGTAKTVAQNTVLENISTSVNRLLEREHLALAANIEVDKNKQLANVETGKVKKIDASKRLTAIIVAGAGSAVAGLVYFIKWLWGKL